MRVHRNVAHSLRDIPEIAAGTDDVDILVAHISDESICMARSVHSLSGIGKSDIPHVYLLTSAYAAKKSVNISSLETSDLTYSSMPLSLKGLRYTPKDLRPEFCVRSR